MREVRPQDAHCEKARLSATRERASAQGVRSYSPQDAHGRHEAARHLLPRQLRKQVQPWTQLDICNTAVSVCIWRHMATCVPSIREVRHTSKVDQFRL